MKVLFVAGFGPIVNDGVASRRLYADAIGIEFEEADDGYLYTDKIDVTRAFALRPLPQAAASRFGSEVWPQEYKVPHAYVEFEVDNVETATDELKEKGYNLLVENRLEPWEQTVTRLLSPEGLLVGITRTPWMRTT